MSKYSIKLVVLVLGFSFRELFAIGNEDGIKFGSVRRGRERLEWMRHTSEILWDRGVDAATLARFRFRLGGATMAVCLVHMASELHRAFTSYPPIKGWDVVEISAPKPRKRVVCAQTHVATLGEKPKPKRKQKTQERVPSDRLLGQKTLGELETIAGRLRIKTNKVKCGFGLDNEEQSEYRLSLLKRLKAKRVRQEKASAE